MRGMSTVIPAPFTPASPFPKKSFALQNLFWEPYPMSLPCARGGSGRGTSLTEGLLHTRESVIDTPSASHSFGTSLHEGGKGARARTRQGGGRGSCAGQEKRVRVRAIARRKRRNFTPSASRSFDTSLVEGGKGMAGGCCDFCGIPEQNKTPKGKTR